MGCDGSTILEERRTKNSEGNRIQNRVGVFEVKIKSIFLHRVMQGSQKLADQTLKLEVSNQSQEYNLAQISFQEGSETVCKFFVNSDWKQFGRMMTVEVRNQKKNNPNIGIGIFDLEPYFLPTSKKQIALNIKNSDSKCFLNYEHSPAGFIQIEVKFHVEPYRELSFQLRSIKLNKQLKGVKNYFARVTIGEEELNTEIFRIQKTEQQQILFDHPSLMMSFKVPDSLLKGQICIMSKIAEKQEFLGWAELEVDKLGEQLETIDSQIFYDNENQPIGAISLTSIQTMKSIPSRTEIDTKVPQKRPNYIPGIDQKPLASGFDRLTFMNLAQPCAKISI